MIPFNFEKDILLENDIVKLRPIHLSDVPYLLDISLEPNIWDHSFIKGDGEKNLTNYISQAIQARKNKSAYTFIVYDKRKQQYAGSTRFSEINSFLNTIRLGYTWYGKQFQGTGLNKHCKYLLFKYAFETIGFERIGLGAYVENERSINAMLSVGCKKEGVFRNMFPSVSGEGRTDAILLSILKEEWLSSEKEKLQYKLTHQA